MRRNRVKSRLDKKTEKIVTKKDISVSSNHSYQNENHTVNNNSELDDIVTIINNDSFRDDLVCQEISSDSHTNQAIFALKNLVTIMQKSNSLKDKQDRLNINAIDPTLDFRFLNRKTTKNIFLPPIKSKLNWQNGEFPFFKIEVRYYNHETLSYKDQRRKNRRIKAIAVQNMGTGHYYDMEYPTEIWPCKGVLYITNLRLFFKRTQSNSFYIAFENIISYSFYNNAVVIEHLQYAQKMVDVFYVDVEQARLLETIIQITL